MENSVFMPSAFEISIDVKTEDIDILGHVNNVVYLRYVQEAAIAHWSNLASKEDQEKYFWVVSRHEIDYLRPIFEGQKIMAKTWVGEARNGMFERFTEIYRKDDSKVVAKARTLWCPIDPQSKRAVKVGPSVYKHFSVNSTQ